MAYNVSPPTPWSDGDNLPWHEPGFSERMLKEHLSQQHDGASRRFVTIDKQVQWIDSTLLPNSTSRVLDLGCGPGFYLRRLALLGHDGVGIDYSPASIAYARDAASRDGLRIQYRCEDIRSAKFGSGFDLAMLIWGEFNVFSPPDAEHILRRVAASLADYGRLVLEVHTYEAIRKRGLHPASQYATDSGLFCSQPHRCIQDNFWHADRHVATTRYTVIERGTGGTTVYAASYQAYTNPEYDDLLRKSGFSTVTAHASLSGEADLSFEDLIVFVAEK